LDQKIYIKGKTDELELMNPAHYTSKAGFLVRRTMVLVFLINFMLCSFLMILIRDSLQCHALNLVLTDECQQEINCLQDELASLKQRVLILKVLKKRVFGVTDQDYYALVDTLLGLQERYNYPPSLILALIQVESSFNNYAVSPKGALGLMQIQPETAEFLCKRLDIAWEGPHMLFDPHFNVLLGTHYLSMLHQRFDDLNCALEAYNKGPERVSAQLACGVKVVGVFSNDVGRYKSEFRQKFTSI